MIEQGTVFEGRYEIDSLLGRGGWGEVYKARQTSTNQIVAVKVIKAEYVSPSKLEKMRARFLRETKLCAQLSHPNVVGLLDAGEMEDGRLYSVFTYVPGNDLRVVLREQGRLSLPETVHLMGQVLDALSAAHSAGVVHRDMKPGNIMVTTTGARRNATVLDFGVGALVRPLDDEVLTQLTATAEFVGTPAYAAPEQLRGQPPTTKSDLYSWGLVFLECLTGEPVMFGASLTEIALKQLGPEPVPIPLPWRDHPLGALLADALVKSLDRRDVTADSLLHRLQSLDLSDLADDVNPVDETLASRVALGDETIDSGDVRRSSESAYSWKNVGGERRQLTAVCATLGVISDGEQELDVEEFDDVLRQARDVCRSVADQYGGRVRSGLGDRIITYFGYPLAREDDPYRAVRSARTLIKAFDEVAAQSGWAGRARVEARVGIDTGDVIVRDGLLSAPGEDDIVGAVPGVSAQLSAIAAPGEILISSRNAKLIRRRVAIESLGRRSLGGVAHPMEVFRPGDADSGRVVLATFFSDDASPMLGRESEYAIVLTRWEQARAGDGQCVLVTGEAGIGKSRLAREFVRHVDQENRRWLEIRCVQDARQSVLRPFVDMLERLLGFTPEWDPDHRWKAIDAFLAQHDLGIDPGRALLGSLLGLDIGHLPQTLEVSPQKQREMTLELLLSFLFDEASKDAFLLVVEDLHWSDPTTLELLGRLVEEAPSAPLCVVLTARPEFQSPWSPTAVHQVQLSRLPAQAVSAMLQNIGGGSPFPQEVVDEIVQRADGISLFVEELAQAVLETGVVREIDGEYQLMKPLSEAGIPLTLRDLLMARLDRTGAAMETAQVAAVIGREFEVPMLEAASTLRPETITKHLQVLRDADLVRHLRRRRGQRESYLFKHALIRDMAYTSLLKADRTVAHARVAEAMEEQFPDLVTTRPDLLAYHHGEAGHFAQAVRFAQQAGTAALARSANAEVLQQVKTAKVWLAGIKDPVAQANAELALDGVALPALMSTQGWANEEIRETVARAEKLIDVVGESPAAFGSTYALALYHHVAGNGAACIASSDKLLHIADDVDDPSLRVGAAAVAANIVWIRGDYTGALEHCAFIEENYVAERDANHASIYGIDSLSYAKVIRGQIQWFCGEPDSGRKLTAEGVEIARDTRIAASHALMMLYILLIETYREDRDALIAVADKVLAMADRYGLPAQQAYAGILRAWASGDRDMLIAILGGLSALGCRLGTTFYEALPAYLDHDAGRYDDALAGIDRCIVVAEEIDEHYYEAELHRRRAQTLLARDASATAEAEAALRRAIEIAQAQGTRTLELHAALDLAKLLVDRGERDAAGGLLAQVIPYVNGGEDISFIVEARTLLGELT